jgi:hypothetical protein
VFEDTQSRSFGLGNVKCADNIEVELVVKCEPDKAGEIDGKSRIREFCNELSVYILTAVKWTVGCYHVCLSVEITYFVLTVICYPGISDRNETGQALYI